MIHKLVEVYMNESLTWHWVEVSDQLRAAFALPPWIETSAPFEKKDGNDVRAYLDASVKNKILFPFLRQE
jgi:hypothetical protein